jgi:hypothetical protein
MLHGQMEVLFVSIIIFTLCPDTLNLNGSIMIINQSVNQRGLWTEGMGRCVPMKIWIHLIAGDTLG